MSVLDEIVAATKIRVARDKAAQPLAELEERAAASKRVPFVFEKALAEPGMSFICEVKRASPSKGMIAEDFPYLDIAADYASAGAAAISVLTEPDFFLGSDRHLLEIRRTVDTPLLRKDFVIDPYQIVQARALGADAVLLICALLPPEELGEFRALADSLGLSCLVEAHDEAELQMALDAGARVVGVNNRDLHTFQVDTSNSIRLRAIAPPEILFVAESGVSRAGDAALLRRHGVDAVLVGEALMRSPDKQAALRALRTEEGEP